MYRGDFSNWVDANGNKLTIYDPRTTRPNPNGTGFIRDPFPGNIIPQDRFSTFAKAVLSAANNVGLPNNGAAPGTSAYVRNNFINNQGTVHRSLDKVQCQNRSCLYRQQQGELPVQLR